MSLVVVNPLAVAEEALVMILVQKWRGAATTEAGAEEGGEIGAAETPVESTNKKGDLLTEENKKNIENKVKKYRNIFHKKLLESINNDEKIYNVDDLDEEVHTQNVKIDQMTKEIDEIIK